MTKKKLTATKGKKKLSANTDDLKNFILMGIIATQKDIHEQMIAVGGLAKAIELIEASYDFGDEFFKASKGPGFLRLNSVKPALETGTILVDALEPFYKVGDPNHPVIVDRILRAIIK